MNDLLFHNLDKFCPEKTLKLSQFDKPFINAELKKLHRRKSREYCKHGKSEKYLKLKKSFKLLNKEEAAKYLEKTINDVKMSNPGKLFSTLRRLGTRPGDTDDGNFFTLPSHENLSDEESAEKIATYFAEISQEYSPIDLELLPQRVKTRLLSVDKPPIVSEHDVYQQILSTKKAKSGVRGDLPGIVNKEFAPELTAPVCKVINNIIQSGEWPYQWKLEYVTPIAKIPAPESEDDLRPISLTPFFSKVTESFIVKWLLSFIGHKIDIRQFGGLKENSTTHYLIEFTNFILHNLDSVDQTAILACTIDFQKAFNRLDHSILVTKLSDLGIPGWLLKVVIGFLKDRRIMVKFGEGFSSEKFVPAGCPQGTKSALLFFLLLINELGFLDQRNNIGDLVTKKRNDDLKSEIHLKFVDDFTVGETIKLTKELVKIPESERTLPESFHARTGHKFPPIRSSVYSQLKNTLKFAIDNKMRINFKKTNLMIFNPCTSIA